VRYPLHSNLFYLMEVERARAATGSNVWASKILGARELILLTGNLTDDATWVKEAELDYNVQQLLPCCSERNHTVNGKFHFRLGLCQVHNIHHTCRGTTISRLKIRKCTIIKYLSHWNTLMQLVLFPEVVSLRKYLNTQAQEDYGSKVKHQPQITCSFFSFSLFMNPV